MGSSSFQVVAVNKSTRRPTQIPDWWKLRYSSSVIGNECLVLPVEHVPTTVTSSCHEMKVPWSEIDIYGHTNFQSYIKFCFDAAAEAVKSDRYATFSGDILRYNVATIQSLYISESCANDVLRVVSWQSPDDPKEVHFSINKDDDGASKTLFQSCMRFYPLSTD